jgi:hypothetical protein
VVGFKAIPGPSIEYNFVTGGDDLRGDSSADSNLEARGGSVLQSVTLKTESQAEWANNSTHVHVLELRHTDPSEVSVIPSALASIWRWPTQARLWLGWGSSARSRASADFVLI